MSVQRDQTQGYSLAVNCLNARDFSKGIQHALQYASLRPRDVRVHELLGQLHEGKKDWKKAIESYKTALQIDPQKSKLGLKVVALYCQLPGEVERLKHWTAQVAKNYPDDPVIHHAQEAIYKGTNRMDQFAEYIRKQLRKDPHNSLFTVKLLECLQEQRKWSEALNQCDCILDALHQDENALQKVVTFNEKLLAGGGSQTLDVVVRSSANLLVSLCYQAQALAGNSRTASKCLDVTARLTEKCVELEPRLANLDKVMKYPCHKLYISEIRGQFQYLMGTYLLQLGLAGSLPVSDVLSKTTALYALSLLEEVKQHNNLINLGWTLTPARILSRLSCNRVGQMWHFLRSVAETYGEDFLVECQRKWCSIEPQKEIFRQAFGTGRNLTFLRGPSFLLTNEPCQINQNVLQELLSSIFKINQESVTSDPENFPLLLWTCLQWDTREDNVPSDFGHFVEETFSNLQFSTNKLKIMTIDNLRMLDLEAFLYAVVIVVRSLLTSQQRGQSVGCLDIHMKNLPLLTIQQKLNMREQEEWFRAVYRLCHSKASSKEYSKLRVLAQRGLEVLRCGSNHGNETLLLVQLGRVMNERMKELKDTDGPGDRCRAYHAMSVMYWTEALGHLKKLANNSAVPVPIKPFFCHVHKDIQPQDIAGYMDEGLVVLAEFCAGGGDVHQALRYLEDVKSPEGQFLKASLYRQLAQEESVPDSEYQLTPTKLTSRGELLDKAKHSLYATMDGISQNANHPLHEKVRTLLVDIESEQDEVARRIGEVDGSSPTLGNESSVYHSMADTSPFREATSDPSPQRLASEIRSLNFSHMQMERDRDVTKKLLDRTLDQNQSMMEQQNKLMEQILKMKQAPPPSQGPTPQPALEGPPPMGGGDLSILNKISDQNEKLYEAMNDMRNQFQDMKKDMLDLKDKIGKLELEQERSKVRELQKQMAAAATAGKAPSQNPSAVPSPAQAVGVPGASMITGHKPLFQQPMYPTAAGVTYIPHPQYPGYMFPVDSSLHPSMMTSTPSVRRSITPKTALPGFAGLGYDNGSSPTEEDEELKQQFVKGFGLGESTEFPDSSRQMSGNQFLPQKGGGTPMRMLGSWQSPSGGSIISGTAAHSPAKPLQGMPGQKMDAATTLAAYAAAAGRQQSLMGAPPTAPGSLGHPKPAATSVPTMATQLTANSLTVPKPIVTSVSTAKPSITQGHLIRSPTPANQMLPSHTKPSEGPAQSPFAGFSFKTAAAGSSGFTTNPAFQSPKTTPATTSAASSPFAGFSVKPSMLDTASTQSSESRATQQYPQLTALLAGGPEGGSKDDVAQPGLSTPEVPTRKPGQSPMGPAATTRSPQQKEDRARKDEADKGGDVDVVVVGEKKATPEQIARAEKLMLPPHFYLYEDKPPCPGCVGCDEEDLQARARAAKAGTSLGTGLGLFGQEKPKEPAVTTTGLFGGSAQPSSGLFSNATGISFASLSAEGDAGGFKKDTSKPFAFANAGAPVFGAPRQDADHDDQEYDPHYEPIVTLPENVEIVTGDEGEDVVFKERAKLYRFDKKTSAWKERGVGNMKILQNPETGQARILMRREQVLKVCANHRLNPDMELKPMSSSDKAWVWFASDFAEGELAHEQLAVKFKFAEMAAAFKEAFDRMKVSKIKEPKDKAAEKDEEGEATAAASGGQESQEPEGGMEHRFQAADPVVTHPAGDGEDGDGGDYDDDDDDEDDDEEDDEYDYDDEGEEYEDEDYDEDYNEKPSLADQFRPPAGSWNCDICFVNNPPDQMQCLACTTPKPGTAQPSANGFGFGGSGSSGLFGSPAAETFSFKAPSGFPSTSSAFSAGAKPGFTFGGSTKPSGTSDSSAGGGFKMPVGFTFGAPKSEEPAEPEAPETTKEKTNAFDFVTPAVNTNSNADTAKAAPDSTVADSGLGMAAAGPLAANKPTTSKFTFGSGMQQYSFGSQSSAKPTSGFSFGSPGAASKNASAGLAFGGASEKAPSAFQGFSFNPKPTASEPGSSSSKEPPSFAGSSQFNFRLDVGNVAASPPKSAEDKPPVKSPGLNKSGEYYQSDERDDLHFEPIVTLPENVVLETGEESEEVKFTHRAKLYRFDAAGSQWKERGVGDIKVLYNPKTGKHRIVMRREQVLKVCANHFITKLVDLKPNVGSARSWVWHAMDVSDGEVQNEQLAVRFKTEDAAKEFKEAVDAAKKMVEAVDEATKTT